MRGIFFVYTGYEVMLKLFVLRAGGPLLGHQGGPLVPLFLPFKFSLKIFGPDKGYHHTHDVPLGEEGVQLTLASSRKPMSEVCSCIVGTKKSRWCVKSSIIHNKTSTNSSLQITHYYTFLSLLGTAYSASALWSTTDVGNDSSEGGN